MEKRITRATKSGDGSKKILKNIKTKAELMESKSIILRGVAIIVAGIAGATSFAATGAASLMSAIGGLLVAFAASALLFIWTLRLERVALQNALSGLQNDIIDLRERQAQSDAKMAEVERRTIESPALVWRAATADIEVLSSLVSDLAKSVGDHERKLAGSDVFTAPAVFVAPAVFAASAQSVSISQLSEPPQPTFSPEWYEAEAELGFTADLASPAADVTGHFSPPRQSDIAPVFVGPSPSVMAELKVTLATALASERLELCLQPIVMLPQRKTIGYEATLRLKGDNGDLQSDTELRRIAAATGLEAESDRVLIERAVQVLRVLRARNREVTMCCAVSANALADSRFRSTIESLVRSDEKLAKAITLEISDTDFRAKLSQTREAMATLGRLGVGIGMANLHNLRFDIADMAASGIRQLRVPERLMQEPSHNGGSVSDIHPADMAELLQRKGITLLVSDISSEQAVLNLLDQAVPFAQGAIFGASRPVRPEVLEPKVVVDQARRSAGQAPQDKPVVDKSPANGRQRQSFRSLLRRA